MAEGLTVSEYRPQCLSTASRATLITLLAVTSAVSAAAINETGGTTASGRQTSGAPMSLTEVVKGAIAPFAAYSDGYGNPGASGAGYIAVATIHTGKTPKELAIRGQVGEGLDGTVAFDRAETSGTYIGQINLVVASSFCGLNGALWGYDVARAVEIAGQKPVKLSEIAATNSSSIPIYPLDPLLDAGARLFGTRDTPRFPLLPGAHVTAAHKEIVAVGPTMVWCGLAIAVAKDRKTDANLIMELCGEYKRKAKGKTEEQYFAQVRENLAKSVMRVGENQNIKYGEMFVGTKHEVIPEGHVGYAMATVPYVVLAKDSVPPGGPEKLVEMTLPEWEQTLGLGKNVVEAIRLDSSIENR